MKITLVVLFGWMFVYIEGVSITMNPEPLLEDQPGSIICSGGTPFNINKDGKQIVTCGNGCSFDSTSTYINNTKIQLTVTSNNISVTVNIPTISRQRDSGPWICTVFNSGSMESTTKNISITDIKVPVSSVAIVNKAGLIFTDREVTDATCIINNQPYPVATITWSINNEDKSIMNPYQYPADKVNNGDMLQCSAYNGFGIRKTDSTTLNIRYPILHINSLIQSQSNNQICVEWKPGYNGRATQTFIVKHSTDYNTWVDSSPIPDRNDGQLIQYCITDLEPETQYYIRLTAKNKFGESQHVYFKTFVNTVKTTGKKVTSGEEYSKGRASGLTSGISSGIGIGIGISLGVVLLMLVAFLIYRRLRIEKRNGSNTDDNYCTLNRGTTSGEPPTYQELNDIRTYENVGAGTNTGIDIIMDSLHKEGNIASTQIPKAEQRLKNKSRA